MGVRHRCWTEDEEMKAPSAKQRGVAREGEPPETKESMGLEAGCSVGPSATMAGGSGLMGAAGVGEQRVGRPGTAFLPGSPGVGTRLQWVHGAGEVGRGGGGCRTLILGVWQQRREEGSGPGC